ncbi:MAG: diaminopimelate epimerase [Clostridiales bacterium]|nr:diaminopimelate epimerase [Clostridiales bacterium]
MKLNFIKVNPTENMTVFILDQISRVRYKDIACQVMKYSSIYAEQVGFIERIDNGSTEMPVRLHMMGGEFCVNAVRAFAAVIVNKGYTNNKNKEEKTLLNIEIYGTREKVRCEVESINSSKYISIAKIPLHEDIYDYCVMYNRLKYKGVIVEFGGIVHFVVDYKIDSKEKFFYESMRQFAKLKDFDAFGVMFFDEKSAYMEPLVYVRQTKSLIYERGCGSGTAAVGIIKARKHNRSIKEHIEQPGGKLLVEIILREDEICSISIGGTVEIVAEGLVYI